MTPTFSYRSTQHQTRLESFLPTGHTGVGALTPVHSGSFKDGM